MRHILPQTLSSDDSQEIGNLEHKESLQPLLPLEYDFNKKIKPSMAVKNYPKLNNLQNAMRRELSDEDLMKLIAYSEKDDVNFLSLNRNDMTVQVCVINYRPLGAKDKFNYPKLA